MQTVSNSVANSSDTLNCVAPVACAPEQPCIFVPADLELLKGDTDTPGALRSATKALVGMVQETPEFGNPNPLYGRFSLSNWAQSSRVNRASLRVCREALDFLEADFLACEAEDVRFWRSEIEAVEAMRSGVVAAAPTPSPDAQAEPQAEEATHDEDGCPTRAYFAKCQSALSDVVQFAEFVIGGHELDLVSSIEEMVALRRSFALAEEALGVVRLAFEDVLEGELEATRKRFDSIAGPILPEPKMEPELDGESE